MTWMEALAKLEELGYSISLNEGKVRYEYVRKEPPEPARVLPLLKHLAEDGCLGQVSEIFDGDAPHKPKGCFAQAWSVAELIRVYMMVNG